MMYVALLRGINVGGKNKVSMAQLVRAMEAAGLKDVSTYINSGNVFFSSIDKPDRLAKQLEQIITDEFGLQVPVLIRSHDNIRKVVSKLPPSLQNNSDIRCDVLFLWESHATEEIISTLPIKQGIDNVNFVANTIIWQVDRSNLTRSGMLRLVGTELYAHMTIRNANTARKLLQIMDQESNK